MKSGKLFSGCFLGLTTYDIFYEVEKLPGINSKEMALDQHASSGGPATNAAIAFSLVGGNSLLVSIIGQHPVSRIIRDDLAQYAVDLIDLDPDPTILPVISSIMILKGTGSRSVLYTDTAKRQIKNLPEGLYRRPFEIVLVDGHQMELSKQLCSFARRENIPCVLDGGSWKDGTEELLQHIDYAICSEDFLPPGCSSSSDAVSYLKEQAVSGIAITRGEKPVLFSDQGVDGFVDIANQSNIRSTLGAGDIFHGSFCYFLLSSGGNFQLALKKASEVATLSCKYLDTRSWASDPDLQKIISGADQ